MLNRDGMLARRWKSGAAKHSRSPGDSSARKKRLTRLFLLGLLQFLFLHRQRRLLLVAFLRVHTFAHALLSLAARPCYRVGHQTPRRRAGPALFGCVLGLGRLARSEEHTTELQSLMRISYAVFCLKKKHTI